MQLNQQVAVAGLRLKSTPEDIRSMPYAGTTLLVDGHAVADHGDGVRCTALTESNSPIGIVVYQNIAKSAQTVTGLAAFQSFDVVPVMRVGRVWVRSTEPVTRTGGTVYVRTSNPDAEHPIGSLQVSSTHATELSGATWDSITGADGLAIIQLRGA